MSLVERNNILTTLPLGLIDWQCGTLTGGAVKNSVKKLSKLSELFLATPPEGDRIVYRVQYVKPSPSGTKGGLNWGVTTIEPGTVGDEYFMTHGHFHADASRSEYYATAEGEGFLLLMGRDRVTRVERMVSGSLHYIPGDKAHRVVNVGRIPLTFWACWPSDVGYDYETIAQQGFSVRVMERAGKPSIEAVE